jgi:hypothetical protein
MIEVDSLHLFLLLISIIWIVNYHRLRKINEQYRQIAENQNEYLKSYIQLYTTAAKKLRQFDGLEVPDGYQVIGLELEQARRPPHTHNYFTRSKG